MTNHKDNQASVKVYLDTQIDIDNIPEIKNKFMKALTNNHSFNDYGIFFAKAHHETEANVIEFTLDHSNQKISYANPEKQLQNLVMVAGIKAFNTIAIGEDEPKGNLRIRKDDEHKISLIQVKSDEPDNKPEQAL